MTTVLAVGFIALAILLLALMGHVVGLTASVKATGKAMDSIADAINQVHVDMFVEMKEAEAAMAREQRRRADIASALSTAPTKSKPH